MLHEPQIVLHHLESADAPLIRIQANCGRDFSYAAMAICKSGDLNGLVATLLDLLFCQFEPFHV
jgi:hypothetical protein